MTDFSKILQHRRSIRSFLEKDVPTPLVMDIIKECCLAPSSANGQPWRFVIVKNKDLIRRLSDESKALHLGAIEENPASPNQKLAAVLRNPAFNIFYNAPCLVFIVTPSHLPERLTDCDCALAACYFMFSAAARGLGTCWIGLGSNIIHPRTRAKIGLSDEYRIVAPIIIGYPQEIPDTPPRHAPQILNIIE
jgi:nitroreductase